MKVTQVLYSITKQVRQYEPVRIEVTVAPDPEREELPAELLEHARDLAEAAMREAILRGKTGAGGF